MILRLQIIFTNFISEGGRKEEYFINDMLHNEFVMLESNILSNYQLKCVFIAMKN